MMFQNMFIIFVGISHLLDRHRGEGADPCEAGRVGGMGLERTFGLVVGQMRNGTTSHTLSW